MDLLLQRFLLERPIQTNKVYYEWATHSACIGFFLLYHYIFCFNYIEDQENIMDNFSVHFVHSEDIKHTTVVGDMEELVCCQNFPFSRHVACFNTSTSTDNALKSCCPYPMPAAPPSDLAIILVILTFCGVSNWQQQMINWWFTPGRKPYVQKSQTMSITDLS